MFGSWPWRRPACLLFTFGLQITWSAGLQNEAVVLPRCTPLARLEVRKIRLLGCTSPGAFLNYSHGATVDAHWSLISIKWQITEECPRILVLLHFATNENSCTKMLWNSAALCDTLQSLWEKKKLLFLYNTLQSMETPILKPCDQLQSQSHGVMWYHPSRGYMTLLSLSHGQNSAAHCNQWKWPVAQFHRMQQAKALQHSVTLCETLRYNGN